MLLSIRYVGNTPLRLTQSVLLLWSPEREFKPARTFLLLNVYKRGSLYYIIENDFVGKRRPLCYD